MVLISLKVFQSELTALLYWPTYKLCFILSAAMSSWRAIWKSSFFLHRPYRLMAERSLILNYVSTPSRGLKRKGWGRQSTWCSQPGCFYSWKQGSLSPRSCGTSLILLPGELSPSQKGSLYFVFNQLFGQISRSVRKKCQYSLLNQWLFHAISFEREFQRQYG